jgi:hypothetical protein
MFLITVLLNTIAQMFYYFLTPIKQASRYGNDYPSIKIDVNREYYQRNKVDL